MPSVPGPSLSPVQRCHVKCHQRHSCSQPCLSDDPIPYLGKNSIGFRAILLIIIIIIIISINNGGILLMELYYSWTRAYSNSTTTKSRSLGTYRCDIDERTDAVVGPNSESEQADKALQAWHQLSCYGDGGIKAGQVLPERRVDDNQIIRLVGGPPAD